MPQAGTRQFASRLGADMKSKQHTQLLSRFLFYGGCFSVIHILTRPGPALDP